MHIVVKWSAACGKVSFPMPQEKVLFCPDRKQYLKRWYVQRGCLSELVKQEEITRWEYHKEILSSMEG